MILPPLATEIIFLGGVAVALGAIWKWILVPAARVARAIGKYVEVHDTIMEIASEFKPNGGRSLHDIVSQILKEMESIKTSQQDLQQQFENHVIDSRPWDDGTERRIFKPKKHP